MIIGIDGHDLEGRRTGVGRYLISILRAWEEANVLTRNRVVLFFKREIPSDLPQRLEPRLLRSPIKHPSNALFIHWLLPRAAKRENLDILWCPGYVAPLWLPRRGWRGARVPLVLTLHDIIYEAHPQLFNWRGPQDRFLLKFVSKSAAKRAARILAPSAFTAHEVERLYRIPAGRVNITPEATDASFRPMPESPDVRATANRYGVTGPYCFFVGSIFTRRRIPECINAFAQIGADFPEHQFLIAGENLTNPRVNLVERIADANIRLRRRAVIWIHALASEDLPALYNAADATIWLSDYEGFGLPPLESLACGTPVITTRAGALPETVGGCARFVENSSDSAAIAEALHDVLGNAALRQQLSACGPQRAAQFSWDRCAEKTLAALRAAREPQK